MDDQDIQFLVLNGVLVKDVVVDSDWAHEMQPDFLAACGAEKKVGLLPISRRMVAVPLALGTFYGYRRLNLEAVLGNDIQKCWGLGFDDGPKDAVLNGLLETVELSCKLSPRQHGAPYEPPPKPVLEKFRLRLDIIEELMIRGWYKCRPASAVEMIAYVHQHQIDQVLEPCHNQYFYPTLYALGDVTFPEGAVPPDESDRLPRGWQQEGRYLTHSTYIDGSFRPARVPVCEVIEIPGRSGLWSRFRLKEIGWESTVRQAPHLAAGLYNPAFLMVLEDDVNGH